MPMIFRILIISSLLTLSACAKHPNRNTHSSVDKKNIQAKNIIQLALQDIQANQLNLAKNKLLKAIKLAPNFSPTWYTYGYYYEINGHKTKAEKYYRKAITLTRADSTQRGDALSHYGAYLCRHHQQTAAIKNLIEATQQKNYLYIASAYQHAALCALSIPNKKLAIQLFTKALKHSPYSIRNLEYLTLLLYQRKNYSQAKIYYQRLNTLAPHNQIALKIKNLIAHRV
jgi:type IV pilus assembly protein PilF